MKSDGIRVCIDRGGTFTDCIGFVPSHIHAKGESFPSGFRTIVVKLLSVDPRNYDDAPREGIRRILEKATGIPHPRNVKVDTRHLRTYCRLDFRIDSNGYDCRN